MSAILWLGPVASHDIVTNAQMRVAEGMKAGRYLDDPDEEDLPPLWELRGEVAIIHVSGALVSGSAGWSRLFGVVGYDDLARAAVTAASQPGINKLAWNFDTPGGDANGVTDAAKVLGQVAALKPSVIYTASQMCSGGYWLASGIRGAAPKTQIVVGEVATIGSIGVVMVLTNMQGYYEQLGIKKTVMRAGDKKVEINPYETPSDEALTRLKGQMAYVHGLFRAAVAKAWPDMAPDALAEVTEGQTFLGKQGVQAGLADKVGSFELA